MTRQNKRLWLPAAIFGGLACAAGVAWGALALATHRALDGLSLNWLDGEAEELL